MIAKVIGITQLNAGMAVKPLVGAHKMRPKKADFCLNP